LIASGEPTLGPPLRESRCRDDARDAQAPGTRRLGRPQRPRCRLPRPRHHGRSNAAWSAAPTCRRRRRLPRSTP